MPEGARGPLKLSATLRYRKFMLPFVKFVAKRRGGDGLTVLHRLEKDFLVDLTEGDAKRRAAEKGFDMVPYAGGGWARRADLSKLPIVLLRPTGGADPSALAGMSHVLVLLPDGRAFTAGGGNRSSISTSPVVLASAEVYDPAAGSWSVMGSLATARMKHRLAVLPMGRVLVSGGQGGSVVGSAEVFDPAAGVFANGGTLVNARFDHTSTAMPDGRVLLAQGNGATGALSSAEIFAANAGPVADAGPAVVGDEGSSFTFSGAGSPLLLRKGLMSSPPRRV